MVDHKRREESSPLSDLEADSHRVDIESLVPVISLGASLNEVETNPYGSRPACFSNTLQECLFVLTTTFAIGQSSIFSGAIVCVTSYIGDDLNMTAAEVTWMSAAQTLSAGAFLLFFGRVADLFGRRLLLLLSLGFFTILLLIMGFASNAIFMDVFCGLLGVSSAAAVPPAIGKLGAVYEKPSRRKNWAFACFSAGNPVGFAIGAFIAGVSMQVASWRAVFWVTAVIYAAFTIVAVFTVPPDVEQKKGGLNRETFAQFDFLGACLAVIGIAMFTASLTLAGDSPHGWSTSYVIVLLVVGILLTAGFVYWQSIFEHPLMPLSVWRDRNFTLLVSTLCLGFYGFMGNIFWMTLFWQRIYQSSPLDVAIRLLPAAIGGIVVNIVAGMIMHRVSNKLMMIVGALGLAIASALLSAMSEHDSYWAFTFPALILSVVGADFEFTVTNMYVMSSLPSEQQSVAGGLFNTVSRLAATVGIGIQTSIFNSAGGSSHGAMSLRYRPYQSTFFVAVTGAGLALLLVPFLTIRSQGAKKGRHRSRDEVKAEK
jgi:MFS family permease